MEVAFAGSYSRFAIPGIAEVTAGNGGLPKVRISSPDAAGEVYLHGAHVTSWKPAGEKEVFFLSSRSRWEEGHAIRGGVPLCFPWFRGKQGDPRAPAHGFVRTKAWQIESIAQVGGAVTVSMFTESDEHTKKWWPSEFRLIHRVTFGRELSLELVVTNTGRTSLRFEEALHAYYHVGNIEVTRARIPDALHYFEGADLNHKKTQLGDILITSETDRLYLNTRDAIELEDPLLRRRICITKENSRTTVVWNPWEQKAHSLSDLAADEWKQLLCIEPCNVSDFAVDLAPGQQHAMKSHIRVVDF
jgi:glucose-6-phosphate 1-epimerase